MKIDWTPLEHSIIALFITLTVGVCLEDLLAGAALASGIFIGREHSEAEYRWMSLHKTNRTGKETLGAFSPDVWDVGSLLDLLLPCLCAGLLWYFLE